MPDNSKGNDVPQGNLPAKPQQDFAKQPVVDPKDLATSQFESAQNSD
jgi:hypothetical protein